MEHTGKNRFSAHHVKIIHDHAVILLFRSLRCMEKLVFFMGKTDLLQCPVQLPEFRLGLLDVLLQLGKKLLPELLLGRLPGLLHLFLIIQEPGVLQANILLMKGSISLIGSRTAKIMGDLIGMHLLFHGLCKLLPTGGIGFSGALKSAAKALQRGSFTPFLLIIFLYALTVLCQTKQKHGNPLRLLCFLFLLPLYTLPRSFHILCALADILGKFVPSGIQCFLFCLHLLQVKLLLQEGSIGADCFQILSDLLLFLFQAPLVLQRAKLVLYFHICGGIQCLQCPTKALLPGPYLPDPGRHLLPLLFSGGQLDLIGLCTDIGCPEDLRLNSTDYMVLIPHTGFGDRNIVTLELFCLFAAVHLSQHHIDVAARIEISGGYLFRKGTCRRDIILLQLSRVDKTYAIGLFFLPQAVIGIDAQIEILR